MSAVAAPSTEQRLLEATLACLARHGIAKTTLDDVAREAGVARATLYRYFPGKQALLADIARVAHIVISYVIVVVASWHIGLGLKHHVFERNGFLRRMLPFCKP